MRKRITKPLTHSVDSAQWLDLEHLAQVEITSEDPQFPIEHALGLSDSAGWRAAQPGPQTLRLLFDEPQRLRRIRLCFVEETMERTQEFVLRWSPDQGQSLREIVRQQWNFSPRVATREAEEYGVNLSGVRILELEIKPDVSGGVARASLAELRLA